MSGMPKYKTFGEAASLLSPDMESFRACLKSLENKGTEGRKEK